MRWIDQYAYGNNLRRLDPAYKAGFSLFILFLCLVFDTPLICALLLLLVVILSVFCAKLPARFVTRLLLAEGGFLLFGILGVAISVSTLPQNGAWSLGPVWVNISPASIDLAIRLFFRSIGCVSAMNFLALTTPLMDLIELLRRMRIPELLIDLMTLIYRFIFTLMDCLDRMVMAQEVRMGFNGWRRSFQSAGQIGANLFIEAFRRSRKLETSLEGRCWEGSFNVLPQDYEGIQFPWMKTHS